MQTRNLPFSFPFSSLPCASPNDAQTLRNLVNTYVSHPNQLQYASRAFVSTFSGETCTFGQSSVPDGWKSQFSQHPDLAGKIYFVPAFFIDPATFTDFADVMDGDFNVSFHLFFTCQNMFDNAFWLVEFRLAYWSHHLLCTETSFLDFWHSKRLSYSFQSRVWCHSGEYCWGKSQYRSQFYLVLIATRSLEIHWCDDNGHTAPWCSSCSPQYSPSSWRPALKTSLYGRCLPLVLHSLWC